MIEQALKVIASFKDEASAGIKKLQDQLNGISKTKTNLGGLSDPQTSASVNKTAEAVKKINDEARSTATGGLRQLSDALGKIKVDFAGLLSGQVSISEALTEPLSDIAASAAGAVAGIGAVGGATAGAAVGIQTLSKGLKEGSDSFRVLTTELKKNGEQYTALGAAGRAVATERLAAAKAAQAQALAEGQTAAAARLAYKEAYNSVAAQKLYADSSNKLALVLSQLKREIDGTAKLPGVSAGIFKAAGVDAFKSSIALIPAALTAAGAAIAAVGAAVGGLSIALNAAADDAAELADKLGISVDRLKTLQLIADETGTSVEGLQSVYDKLTKVLDKTDDSSDKAATALTNLGLSFEEIKKLKPEEAAAVILERYDALGKTAEATAAVQLLLGNSFRDSSLGIKAAAKEFDTYADRVQRYGAGESKILAQQGAEQEVAFNNLALALAGVGRQLAENVGPAITMIVQAFADTINALRKTELAGKLVQFVFGSIKLLIVDLGRLLGGLAAAFVALFSGEFKQALEITKMAFSDAGDAIKNFGQRTEEAKAAADGLTEAEAKAAAEAAKRAAAQKKAAEDRAKLFKDAENDLFRQLELLGKTSEAERIQFEIEKGRYKSLTNNQKALLVDLAQMIDLKKQELDIEQKSKQLQDNLDAEAQSLSLAEEELRFAGLTADEREKQIFLLRELNKLRIEGKDLDEVTLLNMRDQIKVLAERRAALKKAQDEQATQQQIIAESEAAITASVQRNIQLAAELLTARKISEADYVRYVEGQVKRITDLNKQAAEDVGEFWRSAAQGIQGAFQSFFFDFMQGNLTDLVGGVKRAIDQVVANFLAAQVAAALFGNQLGKTGQVGGFVGAAGQFLGGLFGGARAEGGPIEAGKAYLVGEKGPELRTFGSSGSIVSNDKLKNLGSNVSISFRVDAIDAASFRSKIDEFKRDIASAVSDAQVSYGV